MAGWTRPRGSKPVRGDAHRVTGVGRLRRPSVGLAAVLAVLFTLTAGTGTALAVTSNTAAPKLAKSGPAGEGPYPWKYPASGNIKAGTGTTISGTKCAAGTPQFDSPYADPCIPKFTGNNGGATYNGVTATTITLAQREFPSTANSEELAAEARDAGSALPAGDRPGRAGLLELLQQGVRPLRAPRGPQAHDRDREQTRRRSTRARPRPAPTPTDRQPDARLRRGRARLRLPGAAAPGRSHSAWPRTSWSSSTVTPTSTRAPSRARTPTSGRPPRTARG